VKYIDTFLIFEKQKYSKEHQDRKKLISTAIQKGEKWVDKELGYTTVSQGKKLEDKAFKKARQLGEIKVYRVVGIPGIKDMIGSDGEYSCSTSKSKKLPLGINNNRLVISGTGECLTYYSKDVSTNIINKSSKRKLPITPHNKKSDYDEVLVIGKDIEWNVVYYDPEDYTKSELQKELQDLKIEIRSYKSKMVPKLIKDTFTKMDKKTS
jgi:hypothetical protein